MNEQYEKSLTKLELDKVLAMLSDHAASQAAKERCLAVRPSTDADEIRHLLDETSAACACITVKGSPSFGGLYDVGASLDRADRGGCLSPEELLRIAAVLKSARQTKAYSEGDRGKIRCYGCDDVSEGVAVMRKEGVDVSITGNSTNPTRFQHPVAGTYKKECIEQGKKYFSVASGGGTGRTLHPDNMAAGPASYGMTDTMGRMHSDAQFAGSSSVPAHVEMMGFLGMGNNPMVGATVAVAVAVAESLK